MRVVGEYKRAVLPPARSADKPLAGGWRVSSLLMDGLKVGANETSEAEKWNFCGVDFGVDLGPWGNQKCPREGEAPAEP